MFQSESLQEKWKPLLNYEGLDEIKDPHRKAVTAVLLENQEKFLREEQSFSSNGMLMEQPTVNTNSGSTPVLVPVHLHQLLVSIPYLSVLFVVQCQTWSHMT
tara:strand:- start:327 stop:632 length:306 start_codon:yes stop_codon:yes gene_type:complete